MIDNIVAEGDEALKDQAKLNETLPVDKEMSMSMKVQKTMAIDTTIYTASYVSLLKKNKKEYKMTQQD